MPEWISALWEDHLEDTKPNTNFAEHISITFKSMDEILFKETFFDILLEHWIIENDKEKFDTYINELLNCYNKHINSKSNWVEKIYLFYIFNVLKICLNWGQSSYIYTYLEKAKTIYWDNFPYLLRSKLRDIELVMFNL